MLNIVIPLCGEGKRFKDAGYTTPKPFIDVKGQTLIEWALDNIDIIDARVLFIIRENTEYVTRLHEVAPGCKILILDDEPTGGAAKTIMFAEHRLASHDPLIIMNSDQHVKPNLSEILYHFQSHNASAGITVFEADDPKWSYAQIEDGLITKVAEKKVISHWATCGIYYWKHGSDFFYYARKMFTAQLKVNGEYYVCPVYNQAIADGMEVIPYYVEDMYGLGTPEDVQSFCEFYSDN